jgi:hypothetical protein
MLLSLDSGSLLPVCRSKLLHTEFGIHQLAGGNLLYTYNMEEIFKSYPHNPPHLFRSNAVYMVTAAILHQHRLLADASRIWLFCQTLFERAAFHGWQLEAWAVLDNHYHFIAQAPEQASSLPLLIKQIQRLLILRDCTMYI